MDAESLYVNKNVKKPLEMQQTNDLYPQNYKEY